MPSFVIHLSHVGFACIVEDDFKLDNNKICYMQSDVRLTTECSANGKNPTLVLFETDKNSNNVQLVELASILKSEI